MDRPDPPRRRKRPQQSRSLLLVGAIEEACLKILQEEGPEQLSTQRIADVAGINIASLYQYFPNKEAVLAEVFEEQISQYTRAARERFLEIERLSRRSLEDTLSAIVDMEVDQRLLLYRMDPQFYRAYQHSFDIHRRVNELTIALSNPGWEEWFPRFLERHTDRLRSRDVGLLSRVASHALAGVLLSTVAEEPELLDTAAFKEEVVTLLLGYLCS
jgi:AcrR family transcriptional regulator